MTKKELETIDYREGSDSECCGCCLSLKDEGIDGYGVCEHFGIETHCSQVCNLFKHNK